jgi:protein O-mannosyl-transferase
MIEEKHQEEDFSFNDYFVPLTTKKAIIFIIVIGLIVFFNMLFNGFVWDDIVFILHNPEIRIFNIAELIGPNIFNSSGFYRPIPALYFSITYSLFRDFTFFYHLLQLSIHIVNTILVFVLFKKFISKNLSFVLSLIFLIHPIQVESVSFIAATINPLYFLFGIVAFILCLKKDIDIKRIIAISILLLLSVLTKETGILFLLLILFYRAIFLRQHIIKLFLIGATTSIIYLMFRFYIGGVGLTHVSAVPIGSLNLTERLIHIPKIINYYYATFIFPVNLSIDQQWTIRDINFVEFYLPLFIVAMSIILFIIFGFYLHKKRGYFKSFIFFLFWFLIGLLLLIQIFPLDMTVADRWFYFPIVGLLGLIGVTIHAINLPIKKYKNGFYILAAFIIIILSIRTMIRNSNWRDAFTLNTHDSKIHTNFNLENNLASEYSKRGEFDKALQHAKKSVKLFPYENNFLNLAIIYQQMGDMKNAKVNYYEALSKKHYSSIKQKHLLATYKNSIWLLLYEKSYNEAKTILNEALLEYPNDPQLWEEVAICEYGLNNQEQAIDAINKALKLSPNVQEFHNLLLQIQNNKPISLSLFPSQLQY